ESTVEMNLDLLAVDAAAQKIGPQELAERRRVLGETASAAQFAGERAIRVVDQLGNRLRNGAVIAPPSLVVERVHPAAIVEEPPERRPVELAEVRDKRRRDRHHAFLVQGA